MQMRSIEVRPKCMRRGMVDQQGQGEEGRTRQRGRPKGETQTKQMEQGKKAKEATTASISLV